MSEEEGTVPIPQLDAASQALLQLSVNYSVTSLTRVIDDKLEAFGKRFSQENISTVEQAVQKAKRETFTCKRKGNQQQLDHSLRVLEKIDESSDFLKSGSYRKAKRALEEGSGLVLKRIEAIKLADKSEYGWLTVNEYLSDELASDTEDEKRMYRSEKRAEKKKLRKKTSFRESTYRAPVSNSRSEERPVRRLGPCFKISIYIIVALIHTHTSSTSFVYTSDL